jgi:hypothetical protein
LLISSAFLLLAVFLFLLKTFSIGREESPKKENFHSSQTVKTTNKTITKIEIINETLSKTGQPVSFISGGDFDEIVLPEFNSAAKRARKIKLNEDFLKGKLDLNVGDEFVLNLFDDANCKAKIKNISKIKDGNFSLSADLDGENAGTVYLSVSNGRVSGFIESAEDGRIYSIGSKDGENFYAFENDPTKLDRINDTESFAVPAFSIPKGKTLPPVQDNEVEIDVLLLYTPAAEAWARNDFYGPIENIAAMAIERVNKVFADSGTGISVKSVACEKINYVESEKGSGTDLSRLTEKDGVADKAHTLRDKYGADIVTMFTLCNDTGGLAWQYSGQSDDEKYAFNVVRIQQVALSYIYPHELGHNLGAHHSKTQAKEPGPGSYKDSAGWQWIGPDGKGYCTIMTYEDHDNNPFTGMYGGGRDYFRIGLYSSPDNSYRGIATGVSGDSDNVSSMKRNKNAVSVYRERVKAQK